MRRIALAAVLLVALGVLAPAATPNPAAAQTGPTEIVVTGRGYGHGRGLGQYGAYGYAKDHGWTWQQITGHFYGGTTLGTMPAGSHVDVLLKGFSGRETLVFVEQGGLITNVDPQLPPLPGRRAIRAVANADGSFTVFQGADCATWDAGTNVRPAAMGNRSVLIAKPGVEGSDRAAEMVSLCDGATRRFYRGELWVEHFSTAGSAGGSSAAKQHVMNHVWIEAYLRSVVPAESPSSWGNAPGGMNALAAQAVAARSYAAAGDSRWGRATTCDDIFCQVYNGFGRGPSSANVTPGESPNTDRAVAMTEGVVRQSGSSVARTEFSSSTGGFTAGGSFPAVVDDGDDVVGNPNHTWSATVPLGDVEAAFDARAGRDLGAFEGFTVVSRNGLGEDGGRVRSLRADFAGGAVTVTGDQFRSMFQRFGVKSDWFVVSEAQAAGFTDTAGNAHEANIVKVADADIATGYSDRTFRPNNSVTRGQMATFVAKGYALAAASSPTFADTGGDTHEPGIRAVANAGIAQGYSDGTYRPAQEITRGQMAVFLARAENLPLGPTSSAQSFCDTAGHPYEQHIAAVAAAGIASGAADGCYHPDDPVTRGQMATFLARALGL